jgi:hypothetical protein
MRQDRSPHIEGASPMTEPVDWRTICEEQESYPLANILRERPSWLTRVLAGLIVLCVIAMILL